MRGDTKMRVAKGYEVVAEILQKALDQAQSGKGRERHGQGLPFTEQRILSISRALRTDGGLAYQVEKKIQEGREFDDLEQLERELCGAIIYTVAMIIYHREVFAAKAGATPAGGFDRRDSTHWKNGDTVLYVGESNAHHTKGKEYKVLRWGRGPSMNFTVDYSQHDQPNVRIDKKTAEACFELVDVSDKNS